MTATLTMNANPAYMVGSSGSASVTIAGNSVRIGSLKIVGNEVTISWASVAGRTYRVAAKESLADPIWTDVSDNVTATGASTSWVDPDANRFMQRYYVAYMTN